MRRSSDKQAWRLRVERLEDRRLLSAAPQLLANLNHATAGSNPTDFASLGDFVLFSANPGGRWELWRSDGTEEGTLRVTVLDDDVPSDSWPRIPYLSAVGDRAYFELGGSLWTSDGTSEGTDVIYERVGSQRISAPRGFTESNGIVYFSADDPDHGRELWQTDGTSAGTGLVVDLNLGQTDSSIGEIVDVDGTLFFTATTPAAGRELWKVVGDSVELVRDIATGAASSNPGNLEVFDGSLYFTANNGGGIALWTSDGTEEGTVPAFDSEPEWTSPYQTVPIGDRLAVFATSELWITDGTIEGTELLSALPASRIQHSLVVDDQLFFTLRNGDVLDLWVSDGTPSGTQRVAIGTELDSFYDLTGLDGDLYFTQGDSEHGTELWRSDGTEEGTHLVTDLRPGQESAIPGGGNATPGFAVVGDKMLFSASDGTYFSELFASDGTAEGTGLLKDINLIELGSHPREFVDAGGTLYFVSSNGFDPSAIWKSDGTEQGTTLAVAQETSAAGLYFPNWSGNEQYFPIHLTAAGGSALFLAFQVFDDGKVAAVLWKVDDSDAQAVPLATLDDSPYIILGPGPEVVGNEVFLIAVDMASPGGKYVLVKSDGTVEGTGTVRGSDGLALEAGHVTGGLGLAFFARDYAYNPGPLFVTDGTPKGTLQLTLKSFFADSIYFAKNASVVYFAMYNDPIGVQLWRTDGTVLGTTVVRDLGYPYVRDLTDEFMIDVNGTLYFVHDSGQQNEALWKSDGTEAGTIVVHQSASGDYLYDIDDLTSVGGVLYFTAEDDVHGREVWRSDGTEAGTYMLADVNATGDTSSEPSNLVNFDGRLYWSADDGVHGRELWTTDGTPEGTHLVVDLNPAAAGSNPDSLTAINGRLYFSADDGAHGPEPWFLVGSDPGDANGDGTVNDADYTMWADHFLQPGDWGFAQGDFNRDGVVDAGDYTLWADNFDTPTQEAATARVEPTIAAAAPESAAALPQSNRDTSSALDSNVRRDAAWAVSVDGYFARELAHSSQSPGGTFERPSRWQRLRAL